MPKLEEQKIGQDTNIKEKKQSAISYQTKMSETTDKIKAFLNDKNNKSFHYNDHEELDYNSHGQLNLDLALGAAFLQECMLYRSQRGGKTSCALSVAKNFQDHFGRRV